MKRAFVKIDPQTLIDLLTCHSMDVQVRAVSTDQDGALTFELVGGDALPEGVCVLNFETVYPVLGSRNGAATVFKGIKKVD